MRLQCLQCGETTTSTNLDACPSCGDNTHIPSNLDDVVSLEIPRHELRIITFWASNWASAMLPEPDQRALGRVLDKLAMQTDTAMTLSQEIADLRATFGDVLIIRSNGEEIQP